MSVLGPKNLEKKVNQHYIWAYYLLSWSEEKPDIWHTTKKDKISKDSVKMIAKEQRFYEVQKLNQKDILYLKQLIETSKYSICRTHYLDILEKLYLASHKWEKAEKYEDKLSIDKYASLFCNIVENMYCSVENRFRYGLDLLSRGKITPLYDVKMRTNILDYIGTQFFRTLSAKNRFMDTAPNLAIRELADKNWWLVGYLYGYSMSFSLNMKADSFKYTLLECSDANSFISSDNPVININSNPLVSFDLILPISPKYAVVVSESTLFEEGLVKADDSLVNKLNAHIYEQKNVYAFSYTENKLKKLRHMHSKQTTGKP